MTINKKMFHKDKENQNIMKDKENVPDDEAKKQVEIDVKESKQVEVKILNKATKRPKQFP